MSVVPCFERDDLTVTETLRYFQRVLPHRYSGLKVFYPKSSSDVLAVKESASYEFFDPGNDPTGAIAASLYCGRPQIGWIATLHDVLVSMPFGMLASMCGSTAYWNWSEDTDRHQIATWLIEHKFGSMYQEAANRHAQVQTMDGRVYAIDTLKADVSQVDRQIMYYIEQFIEEIDRSLDDLPGIVYARKFEVGTDHTKANPVISCQYYFAEKRK